jgi:hypothetical protein
MRNALTIGCRSSPIRRQPAMVDIDDDWSFGVERGADVATVTHVEPGPSPSVADQFALDQAGEAQEREPVIRLRRSSSRMRSRATVPPSFA